MISALTLGLYRAGVVNEAVAKAAYLGCCIFNFPAASLCVLTGTFHFSPMVRFSCAAVFVLSWSSLMAWLFWNIAARLLGEGQAPDQRGKFDWIGFQVRFFFGFIIGFFLGWRFVKQTTSMTTMSVACLIGGVIGGIAYGVAQPANFWARP